MRFTARSRAGSTLIAVMVTLVASTIFAHQAAEPRAAESKTAMLVCKMIEQSHISHVKINDEISVKLFNRYLDLLDPRKLYFTQADVDALGRDRAKLGEKMKRGNVDFAYNTFDLFLQRVKERNALATKLVDAKHDFTKDEGMVIDAEKLPWAKSDEDMKEALAEAGQVRPALAQARRHPRRRGQRAAEEALSPQRRKLGADGGRRKARTLPLGPHPLPRPALQLHVAADPRRVPHFHGTPPGRDRRGPAAGRRLHRRAKGRPRRSSREGRPAQGGR